ncbi:putative membrane protein [Pedobacter cryoconitis]|uniref:Putative membrane protein n=1 Tax=Pedobacter cryoconitis TaxID=188932 RepID=A0A7X0MJ71_9SPHI|nr:putative membrane protein [Pedobacter cryoconitis]
MKGLINALKALLGLVLIPIGIYSVAYGFSTPSVYNTFFFIGGLLLAGVGVTLLLHVIIYAKD